MDDREIEVADEADERGVEQRVLQGHGARKAEARVALPEPEEQARDEEEHGERGRQDRVDLLADVEAVVLEDLDLARRAQQATAVTDERDERERGQPADAAPEMEVLDQG